MLALIKAQRSEDTDEVQRIVSENKQLRNRSRRASRTSSTSPRAELPTFPLPISPPECSLQTVPVPLATSSPKTICQNASQQTKKDLLDIKPEMTQTDAVTGECLTPSHEDLKCKETMVESVGNDSFGASCDVSSDRSPEPLEMGSSMTGTDSAANSIGSDLDPLPSAKDDTAFSEKDALVKDFAELKPVPPSELIDLSLPVPLLDCSFALRQALSPISPLHSQVHPIITSFTKALVPNSAEEEHVMMSNPLVGLCTPDSTLNGTARNSSLSAPAVDYTQPKVTAPSNSTQPKVPCDHIQPNVPSAYTQPDVPSDYTEPKAPSDATTHPSSNLEESTSVKHPDSLKRPMVEPVLDTALSPSKVQKTVSNSQSLETVGPKVSLNPPALLSTAAQYELFSKLPKSITIVTLPTVTTTSTAVTFTVPSSVTPVPVPAIMSSSEGGTVQTSSATVSSNISHQGLSGVARVSSTYTAAVTVPPIFSMTRKTTRSISRSAKSLPSGKPGLKIM